jgi:GMP synthase-like glutamine amidotransferase
MKVQILQHTKETTPGLTIDWLKSRKLPWAQTCFHLGDSVPSINDFDLLIVCGGGMGAYEDKAYPWMQKEKDLIRKSIEIGKSVVGLCLGSQLIASSLGAEVKKHVGWEVGWHDVEIKDFGKLKAFQFHQDTFDVPAQAELFATNSFCKNQGFKIGKNVFGVQFHPEATAKWIKELAKDPDFPVGDHVQPARKMLADANYISSQQNWFFAELDRLAIKK